MTTHLTRLDAVTSPPMRGPEVTHRQQLLKRNWTHRDYLQGPVDGVFGPETGRACIRAKYWLGYPEHQLAPVFGDQLWDLLTQARPLPDANRELIRKRLAVTKLERLRERAFARALHDVGMKEDPPRSNLSPISRRWGVRGPWCAMAVSEWYLAAGSQAFALHRDYAFVPFLLGAAERGAHGLAIIRPAFVRRGDPVCFDWDRDGVPDHTGLFDRWLDRPAGLFATVEGNTDIGNDSNGGRVLHRTDRRLSEVATFNRAPAFVRVGR